MREDTAHDLLHAWALDAVDPAERDAVEQAIRTDPALAEEARALREVAAQLAQDAAAQPPASLREQTLDLISRTEQEPPSPQAAPAPAAPTAEQSGASSAEATGDAGSDGRPRHADVVSLDHHRRARRRDRWVAAAAVLVAAAVPSVLAVQQNQRADQAEQQVTTVAEALTEPGAELYADDVLGGGRAAAVVVEDDVVFTAQGLPSLPQDQDYQLWVMDEAHADIVSAGLLMPDDGRARAQASGLPAGGDIAVTVEPAGGSPQPTDDPIVLLVTGS